MPDNEDTLRGRQSALLALVPMHIAERCKERVNIQKPTSKTVSTNNILIEDHSIHQRYCCCLMITERVI